MICVSFPWLAHEAALSISIIIFYLYKKIFLGRNNQ